MVSVFGLSPTRITLFRLDFFIGSDKTQGVPRRRDTDKTYEGLSYSRWETSCLPWTRKSSLGLRDTSPSDPSTRSVLGYSTISFVRVLGVFPFIMLCDQR